MARITGVVVLAFLVGASGAGAQTPSPDPAPLPPATPPVVEPAPTPLEQAVREQPKPKHKDRPAPVVQTPLHPTLAEEVPEFLSSRAAASKTTVIPALAPVVAAAGSHGSPIVLILIFLLGSASLLAALLKDVPVGRLGAVPVVLTEHRGEVMYISSGLVLGIGIGLLAAYSLQ